MKAAIQTIESSRADYELVVAAARSIEAEVEIRINTCLHTLKGVATNSEFISRMDEYEAMCTSLKRAFEDFTADSRGGRANLLSALSGLQLLAKQFKARTPSAGP